MSKKKFKKCKCGLLIPPGKTNCGLCNKFRPRRTGREFNAGKSDKWRMSILLKYKFKCDICGSNKKPQAHHLNNWANFPADRYDENNGVCLCREHHRDFHKKFGYYCTRADYLLYKRQNPRIK